MREVSDHRLVIIGNPNPIHIGSHLINAAHSMGFRVDLYDTNVAFDASRLVLKLSWQLFGRRPPKLGIFSRKIVEICRATRPNILLATGLAPLNEFALIEIGRLGVTRLNYLTDDPWNLQHQAPWFLHALPRYDFIFSPRQANLADLKQTGCHHVIYLPFAYNPELHFIDPPQTAEEQQNFATDIMFAGGADRDRLPWITTLIESGFQVALYGGYWERFRETRTHTSGLADMPTLRKAVSGAKVVLCLVRRANRDGHVMRSFEVPAMGGCMLTEDTAEHREIFGPEGEAVVYFSTIDEMVTKLHWLLDHPSERQRLATAVHQRITSGDHTYNNRLITMVEHSNVITH